MSEEITNKRTEEIIDFVHTSSMFSSNPIDDCPKCKCPIYFACPNCIMKALEKQYQLGFDEGKSVQRTKDLAFCNPIIINRTWAMPNLKTFTIKPIKELINKYKNNEEWIDPFPYPYKQDALEFLKDKKDNSIYGVLFDPPYSPRQLKECYDSMGLVLHDTKSSVWKQWKDEIARVIKPNGLCLSFGWSTNGLGKERGFEVIEILLVAHGGNHNDTICVVERKIK